MNKIRLRILTLDSVGKEGEEAAERAAGSFSRFGVFCESAGFGREALRNVRYRSFVRDILASPERHCISDLATGRILDILGEVFFTKGIIGIGVTDKSIYSREGCMKRELIGAGLFGSCAFISTKIIGSFPPESRGRAIEAAAKHEIGHTLIDIDGHCPDGRCIMQANDGSIERFLEIARLGLDFCGPCTLAIGRGVRILEDGAITRGRSDPLFD